MGLDELEVLILVGGEGRRLRSVISEVPKPLAPISGRPFLEHLILFLDMQGFRKFRFLTGYKADEIHRCMESFCRPHWSFFYSHEESPLGTGGAIAQAVAQSTSEMFLCLNGDTFFQTSMAEFVRNAEDLVPKNSDGLTIALRTIPFADRYGIVDLGMNSEIIGFCSDNLRENALINAGVYFFRRSFVKHLPRGFVSIESQVFPKMAEKKRLFGLSCDGFFIDIGVPEDYRRANESDVFKGL